MKAVEITTEPTELYKILKFEGIVTSGSEAKSAIDDGQVLVNGEVEKRRRKKIVAGDVIECMNTRIKIVFQGSNTHSV